MKKKNKKAKIVTPGRIFILIMLVMANSFAWFIYATKINGEVSGHVRAWNIVFEAGNTQITDVVNIDVASIYPGMTDYLYNLSIYNHSDVGASITYKVLEARILNDRYVTTEGRQEYSQEILPTDLTSAQLLTKLSNDYPFTINIGVTGGNMSSNNGQGTFSLGVVWPYENNQDELDTTWGINAYNYKESNPTLPTISLKVKLFITQNLD